MPKYLISRGLDGQSLWIFSLGLVLFALVGALAMGCFSMTHALPEPEPEPEPWPEPEPEPWPEPCPFASYWTEVNVAYPDNWDIQVETSIFNSKCNSEPLYVFNDCCYGPFVRLERLGADGTVEAVPAQWDCICGGPTEPLIIDPGDSLTLPSAGWWFQEDGNYRWVLDVSSWWEDCPDTDPWTCAYNHPWVEHETGWFWVDVDG